MVAAPSTIIAGDSLAWEVDLDDYPAGVWSLTYYFSSAVRSFTVGTTADGTTHVVAVADSSAYVAGRYRWHARVTDGATIATLADGWTDIRPNPAGANVDYRSHARKMVDAIRATLEGYATKKQLDLVSYAVGSTINVRRDRELLLKMLDRYQLELATEEGGSLNNRHVRLRFVRP